MRTARPHVRWLVCLLLISGASCRGKPKDDLPSDEPTYQDKGLSAWLNQMEDADSEKRAKAAWALGDLRPKSPRAVPALVRALGDEHPSVRAMAAQSLGWLGPLARDAVPDLIRLVKQDAHTAPLAAKALGEIGPEASEAVPALIDLLKTSKGDTATGAAVSLGQIGPAAKAAVPALIEALSRGEPAGRSSAAQALGQIGPAAKEAVPALVAALKDNSTRGAAVRALGEIGPEARASVLALRTLMNERADDPELTWVAAARALALIDAAEAKPAVPDLVALVRKYKGSHPGDVRSRQRYRAASEALKAIDQAAAEKEAIR